MNRNVKLRELLVGVEGLALLRHLYDGSSADAEMRMAEVHRLLEDDLFSAGERMREEGPRTGYRAWSDHYDEPGNPVIAVEEPAVWSLLGSIAGGDCLDAASRAGQAAMPDNLLTLVTRSSGLTLRPRCSAEPGRTFPRALSSKPTYRTSRQKTSALTPSSVGWHWLMSLIWRPGLSSSAESFDPEGAWSSRFCIPSRRTWDGTRRSRTPSADGALSGSTPTRTPITSRRSLGRV